MMHKLRGYERRVLSPRSEFTERFRWSVWLQYSFIKEPTPYALAWDEQDALSLASRFVEKVVKDGAKCENDVTARRDGGWSWVISNHTTEKTIRVWIQEDVAEEQKEQAGVSLPPMMFSQDSLENKDEPVRHGRWEWEPGYVGTEARCSVCKRSPRGFYSLPKSQIGRLPEFPFCPECGATMDVEGTKKENKEE